MNQPVLKPSIAEALTDALDQPFWEGCRSGQLLVHRCAQCGTSHWPASSCLKHGGDNMVWTPASGLGTIHTFTVIHQRYHPGFENERPYNVIVVRLDEGPLMHSQLIDFRPEQLKIDCRVAVRFSAGTGTDVLPRFAPI